MHNFTLILKTDLSMDDLAELCSEHVGDATLVSCCGVLTLDFERASKFSDCLRYRGLSAGLARSFEVEC